MNYEKALRILRLKSNFNEEDLKRAHRELANIYHPDRNKSSEAESKMKDINEARDFLIKYLKNNNTKNTSEQTKNEEYYYNKNQQEVQNIANHRKKQYERIKEIIKFEFDNYNTSKNIEKLIINLKDILTSFRINTFEKNQQEIDKQYEECINKRN